MTAQQTEWRTMAHGVRIAHVAGVLVVIRPIPPKLDGSRWRLFVGGQIAMGNQFHRRLADAKRKGVELAELMKRT